MNEPDAPESASNDDAWHDRLLASLEGCQRRPGSSASIFRSLLSFLVALAIGLVSAIALPALIGNLRPHEAPLGIAIAIAWVPFFIFVLARVRNSLIRNSAKARARGAESALKKAGGKRPILYLRSFRLDRQMEKRSLLERFLGTMPLATDEQRLTRRLNKLGPVIAIGKPEEKLPPLGAARFYVSDDQWKQKVEEIARESQLVVWASGTTRGLQWEIQHLVECLPPGKLVLWAHPHLMKLAKTRREEEWTAFLDLIGGHFPHPLPRELGSIRFFRFAEDWTPVGVAPQSQRGDWLLMKFPSAQESALRALLRSKESPAAEAQRKKKRRKMVRILWSVLAITVAIIAGLVWNDYRLARISIDRGAPDGMAISMLWDEPSNPGEKTPDQILEALRQSAGWNYGKSPQRIEEVRAVARDYVAIFEEADKTSQLQAMLYANAPSLLVDLPDADEARRRVDAVREVRAKIALFLEHFGSLSDWPNQELVKRTRARDAVLLAEENLLAMLIEHPADWRPVMSPLWQQDGIESATLGHPAERSVPIFPDGSLREAFHEKVNQRGGAMAALLEILPQ